MTPQQTDSRRYKRLFAIAAATIVVAGGTIGLAFAADSDDTGARTVKPVATAPASPVPTVGTHYPSPPPPGAEHGGTTREDGGPEEGTRGPSGPDGASTACVDPQSSGSGPQHC